jgi:hypothetical protein
MMDEFCVYKEFPANRPIAALMKGGGLKTGLVGDDGISVKPGDDDKNGHAINRLDVYASNLYEGKLACIHLGNMCGIMSCVFILMRSRLVNGHT